MSKGSYYICEQWRLRRVCAVSLEPSLFANAIWATSWENLFMADQPAHPRSLISTFVVRCIDSIIPLVSISTILSFYLVSVAAQAGLSLTWSETPKTGFLVTWLIFNTSESFRQRAISLALLSGCVGIFEGSQKYNVTIPFFVTRFINGLP